jgi:hypothetical protein
MGLNPVEAFAKNFVNSLKAKLSKLDIDKDGTADVQEIEADIAALEADVAPLLSKLNASDINTVLTGLNATYLGNRFTPAEITALEGAISKGYDIFLHVEGLAKNLGSVL